MSIGVYVDAHAGHGQARQRAPNYRARAARPVYEGVRASVYLYGLLAWLTCMAHLHCLPLWLTSIIVYLSATVELQAYVREQIQHWMGPTLDRKNTR